VKIAQICPRFYPDIGGVETHVYEIAKRLAKEFEVEVVTTDSSGKLSKFEEKDGIKIKRFKSLAPNDAYYFSLGLYKYLKKQNYDIIHAHNYHAFPALFSALAKKDSKFVFTPHYHGFGHSFLRNLLHRPYKLIGRKIFERSDAVICVSKYEKDLILRNFNLKANVYVVPNGVNLKEFRNIDEIRKKKDERIKTILYVGRIEKYKGLDYVVKALKHLPENFTLEVVGKGSYKPKILQLAEELGVLDRIKFYQDLSREKLIENYAKADVLVLLSKYEAYGMTVAEALASKTPCIVANTSALSEWIDNRNVFGVDFPIDVKKLVEVIAKTMDVEVKDVNLLSWDDVCEKIADIYFDREVSLIETF
jgi:glycosyltransferase involved in cell wall biosynthesis